MFKLNTTFTFRRPFTFVHVYRNNSQRCLRHRCPCGEHENEATSRSEDT